MIEIKNITMIYPDGKKALDEINLTIQKDENVAIVGANGAGKSSLLLSLVGVLHPSDGQIIVDEIPIEKKTLTKIREKVGIVFQNPDDLLFMTRVYDDIAFGPRNYNLSEEEVSARVDHVIKRMQIEHLKDRAPHNMSGGEKRSVAIACVLSMQPSYLLFDEPTSFLDPKARRNLIGILNSLDVTKIITTHDLDMALDVCNRVIVLKNGKVFADGPAKEILTDPVLMEEAGLELPFCYQKCDQN